MQIAKITFDIVLKQIKLEKKSISLFLENKGILGFYNFSFIMNIRVEK